MGALVRGSFNLFVSDERRFLEFLDSDDHVKRYRMVQQVASGDFLKYMPSSPNASQCKDVKLAVFSREEGNKAFKNRKLAEALELYNSSIRRAPFPSTYANPQNPNKKNIPGVQVNSREKEELECLPLAVANRSAVLYHMGRYTHRL